MTNTTRSKLQPGYNFSSLAELIKNVEMTDQQKKSADQLRSFGLPTPKVEAWKYTNLKKLSEKKYALPETKDALSEVKSFVSLLEAAKDFERVSFINGYLVGKFDETKLSVSERSAKEKISSSKVFEDGFTHLNVGFGPQPLNVELKDGSSILFDMIASDDGNLAEGTSLLMQNNIAFSVAAKATATMVLSFANEGSSASLMNMLHKFDIGQGAKLEVVVLQNANLESDYVHRMEFSCQSNAQLNMVVVSKGAKLARTEVAISTLGESCKVNADAVVLALEGQHHDMRMDMNHNFPKGESDQLFKSILSKASRAVFNGKIFIAPQAQEIDSNLLNNNMVLDKKSEVDTKPELDIYADNVKATHGATVGQLSEDELFYLQSRAIPKEQASMMLAQGFVVEPVYKLESEKLKSLVLEAMSAGQWLEGLEIEND